MSAWLVERTIGGMFVEVGKIGGRTLNRTGGGAARTVLMLPTEARAMVFARSMSFRSHANASHQHRVQRVAAAATANRSDSSSTSWLFSTLQRGKLVPLARTFPGSLLARIEAHQRQQQWKSLLCSHIQEAPTLHARQSALFSTASALATRRRCAVGGGGGRKRHLSGQDKQAMIDNFSKQQHRHQQGVRRMWFGIGGALACAYAWWGFYFYVVAQKENEKKRPRIMEAPDGFSDDYIHPYHSKPWIIKALVVAKRLLVVTVYFAPFLAVSVLMVLFQPSEGSTIRSLWLKFLVHGCEMCGCSFQKFGQWMSMRPDMMPPDVIDALSKLRHDAPVHSISSTRRVLQEALGHHVDVQDVFERFDAEPVASGSVAQTHHARLRPEHALEGRSLDVAVKVRHPLVVEESFVDIDIIFAFINFMGWVKGGGEAGGRMIIPVTKDEFQRILQRQIDLRWEAFNLSRFHSNFWGNEGDLRFPVVHENLLHEGLLVENWIEGETVSGILVEVGQGLKAIAPSVELSSERVRKAKMARTLFDMTMKMFLRDNLIHGDLHGGNVMVSPKSEIVTVIDAGLVTGVNLDVRTSYCEFLKALCEGKGDIIVDKLVEFCTEKEPPTGEKLEAFKQDVWETLDKWVGPGLKDPDGESPIQLGDVVGGLLFNVQRHGMSLRGDVAGTIVSMSLVEGLVKQLDPGFDIVATAIPYFNYFPPPLVDKTKGFLAVKNLSVNSG